MLTVWVEGWQMQCCGEPFTVGSSVTWTLAPRGDREWLTCVLGEDLAATVTHIEDHHDLVPDDTPSITGVVRSLRAVFCRYAPRQGDPWTGYPVPGSAFLPTRTRGSGWEPESDGLTFVGYLVQVDDSEPDQP